MNHVASLGKFGVDLAMTLIKRIPECRVLLFSGHATLADLSGAREAGHDFPLLHKPVHPAELLKKVSKCLGDAWTATKPRPYEIRVSAGSLQTA